MEGGEEGTRVWKEVKKELGCGSKVKQNVDWEQMRTLERRGESSDR